MAGALPGYPFRGQSMSKELKVINFMRFRKPLGIVSGIMLVICLLSIIFRGLNLGQDFTGGTSIELNFSQAVSQEYVMGHLQAAGFKDLVVQHLGKASDILIRLPPQKITHANIGQDIVNAVNSTGNPALLKSVDSVGSEVGSELYQQSVLAVVLALGLMAMFVALRFKFNFAFGALMALSHDVLFTVGIFSIFHLPFDLTVLAAVLALIGYSLNEAIVEFDRIRENFRKLRKATPLEVVNISLTETLRRTLKTITTVLLVVLALLIVGGSALHWFAIAMLIGIFVGTYSSIYIATSYALSMGLSKEDFVVNKRRLLDDRP